MQVRSNMVAARYSDNDVEEIGCGIRIRAVGTSFGFCQATTVDGETVACLTTDPVLFDAIDFVDDYSFILYEWTEDLTLGNFTCTSIGVSTQSFYLPDQPKNYLISAIPQPSLRI